MAKSNIFDESMTNDKKIEHIGKMIQRLSRHSVKTSIAIIPPSIISVYKGSIDETGVRGEVLNYILFKGNITKGIILFDEKPKSIVEVKATIINEEEGTTKSFFVNIKKSIVDLDIPTEDGSKLVIEVINNDEKYVIKNLWIGFLWQANLSESKIKQLLLDELDKVEDVTTGV